MPPAAGSNRSFGHEAATTAPPDAVWRVWMDVASWRLWDGGLADAEGSVSALGARGVVIDRAGRRLPFEVVAFEAGRAHAFATRLPGGALIVRRAVVGVGVGAGPTRFRHDVRFTGIGGAALAPLLGPGFRRALPPTMQAVARRAEAAAR